MKGLGFFDSFNVEALKINLDLIAVRSNNLQKKKTELSKKKRLDIANYIKEKRIEFARIAVEEIIREDYLVEVLEYLEIYSKLISTRISVIENTKDVPQVLEKPIASVIWLCPRLKTYIPEFQVVQKQFVKKYGKEFVDECIANSKDKVDPKIVLKMQIISPPSSLIENYMIEIANTYEVPFEPDPKLLHGVTPEGNLLDSFDPKNIGFDSPFGPPPLPISSKHDFDFNENAVSDIVKKSLDLEENKSADFNSNDDILNSNEKNSLPPPYKPSAPSFPNSDLNLPDPLDAKKDSKPKQEDEKSENIDFDDLSKRFEALKKNK